MRSLMVACGLALLAANPAEAQLNICNKSPNPITVAIAFDTADQPVSMGWNDLAPNGCAEVVSNELNQPFYYFYAYDKKSQMEWTGPYRFCTSNEASFSIQGASDCEARSYKTVGFSQFKTDTYKKFTFNIIGPETAAVTQETVTIAPSVSSMEQAISDQMVAEEPAEDLNLKPEEMKVILDGNRALPGVEMGGEKPASEETSMPAPPPEPKTVEPAAEPQTAPSP